jgi:hypothetical protein
MGDEGESNIKPTHRDVATVTYLWKRRKVSKQTCKDRLFVTTSQKAFAGIRSSFVRSSLIMAMASSDAGSARLKLSLGRNGKNSCPSCAEHVCESQCVHHSKANSNELLGELYKQRLEEAGTQERQSLCVLYPIQTQRDVG